MTSKVVQLHARRFTPPSPPPRLAAPRGSHVYLVAGEDGGWIVVDASQTGDSAGMHGWHANRDDAMAEGRQLARDIGGRFLDDERDAA